MMTIPVGHVQHSILDRGNETPTVKDVTNRVSGVGHMFVIKNLWRDLRSEGVTR